MNPFFLANVLKISKPYELHLQNKPISAQFDYFFTKKKQLWMITGFLEISSRLLNYKTCFFLVKFILNSLYSIKLPKNTIMEL